MTRVGRGTPRRDSAGVEIFIKIVTVVGIMEWVCVVLWLFYSSSNGLRP
jgi:hypothetical protein